MSTSSTHTKQLKPAAFQIDYIPTLIGLYSSLYGVHLSSARTFNLGRGIFAFLATFVSVTLIVGVGYVIWLRRPLKPQKEKMRSWREIKLKLGFWNLLWQMWVLLLGLAVLIALTNGAFASTSPARPSLWIYLMFHTSSALLYGLMTSCLSWLVTRRLILAPLTSTS